MQNTKIVINIHFISSILIIFSIHSSSSYSLTFFSSFDSDFAGGCWTLELSFGSCFSSDTDFVAFALGLSWILWGFVACVSDSVIGLESVSCKQDSLAGAEPVMMNVDLSDDVEGLVFGLVSKTEMGVPLE